MPYQSRWPLSPPNVSIPSFIFNDPGREDEKVFLDANAPDRYYFTLRTYREWSKRFAAGLVAAGLQQGNRVMLFSGNQFFTPIVVMGVIMAGGIYNSANPAFTSRELAHQLRDCGPKFILTASNCITCAREAADVVGIPHEQIFLFEDFPLDSRPEVPANANREDHSIQHWRYLIANADVGKRYSWQELDTPVLANRTAVLFYSSGTTGSPKGVEATHYNLVTNMMQFITLQFSQKRTYERRGLSVLPMYHGLGLVYFGFVAPKVGIQTFLMRRYNLDEMLSCIERFRVTELLLVPPIVIAMSKNPAARKYDLSSIRRVMSGAAPLGMEVTQQFEESLSNNIRVRQAWGMSELPCIGLCWSEEESHGVPSSISVGEVVPGVEIKLVREDGSEETRPYHNGELWARGPNVMKGYWRNPAATAETKTPDGWLRSGDVAHRDDNMKWYIVDRKKELIKVRGVQVAPAELEALLLEHPQIIDGAVVGVKTATGDEEPRAYVVPKNRELVNENEIAQWVASKVSKPKRLTGGVVFVDAIPRNPSGKILRRQIRDWAAKEKTSNQARL